MKKGENENKKSKEDLIVIDLKPLHVLVAGGAGYIGSVTSASLIGEGHRVTILDNLSKGHLNAVHAESRFIHGDISDTVLVKKICSEGIDSVMHFAAFIEVGESVKDPAKYYRNNFLNTVKFLDALLSSGVKRIVFSSSAAVYGEPEIVPISEDAPLKPVNPYGWTKIMIEQVLNDYSRAYDLNAVSLRYFNAGGAHMTFGEDHCPESHLIPLILNAAISSSPLKVFGDDYVTRDGTCIRDYIHVRDLAEAHILSLKYLVNGGKTDAFNLGTGSGYSVLEVIKTVEKITGRVVKFQIVSRRPGDSPALVASPQKAQQVLYLRKNLAGLEEIVSSAYEWKLKHPHGYEK
jgi:UDP-glucose 4-epimerase